MSSKGRFIVVEGLEGAGKSTVIQTIKNFLSSYISSVIVIREPGGTHVGEVVRTLIKGKDSDEPLCNQSELFLLYAARSQLVEQVIKPSLEQGTWVIADRFELSTYAYQGGGRHFDTQVINSLSAIALKGFKPDLIFFLDIDPSTGLQRAQLRGGSDRIERESLKFFQDVYNAYHRQIQGMDNVTKIDASQSVEVVQQLITDRLHLFINTNVE